MEFLDSLFDSKIEEGTAVTVGKFDGIHKGHGILARELMHRQELGLSSCMVTFVNSPRIALKKDETPSLITNREREFMLENMGLKYLVECPFDERLMTTSAEDFVALLCDRLNMKFMVVGSDFHFGYKGLGDAALLRRLSQQYGFELCVVDKLKKDERDISSTYIREELTAGNISLVNELLGYDYFVWGQVVHGAHLGHSLGMPTINIMPPKEKLVPKFGVYVTTIELDGRTRHGVTNVGMKPTVTNENKLGIETHILDYSGDLYGEYIKVTFKDFLRPEMKFDSIEALKAQMNADKLKAHSFFNK